MQETGPNTLVQSVRLTALVALLVLAAVPVLAGPVYNVTTSGALIPGSWSSGYGISNAGQVVGGTASSSPGNPQAFTWTPPGAMTGLAPLPTGTRGEAFGVNNSGQVAGTSNILVPNPLVVNGFYNEARATVWDSSGTPTNLGAFTSDANSRSTATAINSSGVVVGSSATESSGNMHGFVWPGTGAIQDIGTLTGGSWSEARGINSAGDIVGSGGNSTDQTRGFLRLAGETTLTALAPFGTDTGSEANAIDDSGQIAGVSQGASYVPRAVRWVNSTPQLLGSLNASYIYDIVHGINNSHWIVGASMVDASNYHAALWADGVLYDLNSLISDPNWTLTEAYAINNSGQIVGVGSYTAPVELDGGPLTEDCSQCVFLLTRADSDVPEPSTAALGALGLAALAILRRLAA
jgi:probable HAF family extracellular repeat protein